MTSLASRTVDEADHVVRALAGMRVALSRLEQLCPECCTETAVMRVQMCEVLAWSNAVKASLGALRMTGEIAGKAEMGKVESGNGGGDHALAGAATGTCALGTMRPTYDAETEQRRMLESLHRSGDHTLDEGEGGPHV